MPRTPPVALLLFAAAVGVWAALLFSAPRLPAPLAAVVYAVGSFICHQRPERSFYADGAQLPVCARCTGIYVGALVVLAGVWWSRGLTPLLWRDRGPLKVAVLLASLPTAVTVAAEWAGWWFPGNSVRAVAGAPLGAMLSLVVLTALSTLHYGECLPRPAAAHPPPPTHI